MFFLNFCTNPVFTRYFYDTTLQLVSKTLSRFQIPRNVWCADGHGKVNKCRKRQRETLQDKSKMFDAVVNMYFVGQYAPRREGVPSGCPEVAALESPTATARER